MESKERDNIIRLISLSRAGLNLPYKKIVAWLLIFSFSITNLTYGYERRDVDYLRRVYGPENELVEEKVKGKNWSNKPKESPPESIARKIDVDGKNPLLILTSIAAGRFWDSAFLTRGETLLTLTLVCTIAIILFKIAKSTSRKYRKYKHKIKNFHIQYSQENTRESVLTYLEEEFEGMTFGLSNISNLLRYCLSSIEKEPALKKHEDLRKKFREAIGKLSNFEDMVNKESWFMTIPERYAKYDISSLIKLLNFSRSKTLVEELLKITNPIEEDVKKLREVEGLSEKSKNELLPRLSEFVGLTKIYEKFVLEKEASDKEENLELYETLEETFSFWNIQAGRSRAEIEDIKDGEGNKKRETTRIIIVPRVDKKSFPWDEIEGLNIKANRHRIRWKILNTIAGVAKKMKGKSTKSIRDEIHVSVDIQKDEGRVCLHIGSDTLHLPLKESAYERRERLSADPIDEKCPYPTWARKTSSIYNIFLRRCIRPGTEKNRTGTFTDLKWKFNQIHKMGFGMALLMPLAEPAFSDIDKFNSPYAPMSIYGLDPEYIDVKAIEDVEAIELPGRDIIEKFHHLRNHPKKKPADYDKIISDINLKEYADARAIRALRDNHKRYRKLIHSVLKDYRQNRFMSLSNEKIRETEVYKILCELALFEQYFARKQFKEVIDYGHELGLFILYSMPAFRSVIGAASISHPEILKHDSHGNLVNPGWHIGTAEEQRWWPLADYNEAYLKEKNYKPLIDAFKYWIEEYEVDGLVGDGWHYFYGYGGYWDEVAKLCRKKRILFIGETTGCYNADLVNARNQSLGNLEDVLSHIDVDRGITPTPERLKGDFTYHNRYPAVYFSSTHDWHRIPTRYGAMFGWTKNHDVIARSIHTLFAMASGFWAVFQDDEKISNWRIHKPGIESTWPGGYDKARGNIRQFLKRLNQIRQRNLYLTNSNNLIWYPVSFGKGELPVSYDRAGVLAFGRFSEDRKKAVISIVNLSNNERWGIAHLKLDDMNIDITQKFTLHDFFNNKELEFIPGKNIYNDGSIYYKLAPGQSHIFEFDIEKKDVQKDIISQDGTDYFEDDEGIRVFSGSPMPNIPYIVKEIINKHPNILFKDLIQRVKAELPIPLDSSLEAAYPNLEREVKKCLPAEKPTRVVLEIDGRALRDTYKTTIDRIPKKFWKWIASLGIKIIWIKAPWKESHFSKWYMNRFSKLHKEKNIKNRASGYDVGEYKINLIIARKHKKFKALAKWLRKKLGITIIIDFVTNHLASDSPLIHQIPGLVSTYTFKEFCQTARKQFVKARTLSDKELASQLLEGDRRAFSRFSPNPENPLYNLIIELARYNLPDQAMENLGMRNLAQINYMDQRARRYMIDQILPTIASLTAQGGLRADLAFLALKLHVYDVWARPLGMGWEEFEKRMPREFWDEFMEEVRKKYPGMLVIAETYEVERKKWERPWTGRAGILQKFGMITYDKILYDLLQAGNIDQLRWYLFHKLSGCPLGFHEKNIHFVENHDEPSWLEAFGSLRRAMVAAVISYTIPGYVLIPLRQLFGMGIPEGAVLRPGHKSADAGVYKFKYPDIFTDKSCIISELADLVRLISRPIFREGGFYNAKHESLEFLRKGIWEKMYDLKNSGFILFVRHLDTKDAIVLANDSGRWRRIIINLSEVFDYYKDEAKAPRSILGILSDTFCSDRLKYDINNKERRLTVELPPWGYGIFCFGEKEAELIPGSPAPNISSIVGEILKQHPDISFDTLIEKVKEELPVLPGGNLEAAYPSLKDKVVTILLKNLNHPDLTGTGQRIRSAAAKILLFKEKRKEGIGILEKIIIEQDKKIESSQHNWNILFGAVISRNNLSLDKSENPTIRKYQQDLKWLPDDRGRRDLHVHSNLSDGLKSLEGLILEAVRTGTKWLGIADHNSVVGIDKAMELGEEYGINIIPCCEFEGGVKVTSKKRGKLHGNNHILGYYLDYKDPKIIELCQEQHARALLRHTWQVFMLQEFVKNRKISAGCEKIIIKKEEFRAVDISDLSQVILAAIDRQISVFKENNLHKEARRAQEVYDDLDRNWDENIQKLKGLLNNMTQKEGIYHLKPEEIDFVKKVFVYANLKPILDILNALAKVIKDEKIELDNLTSELIYRWSAEERCKVTCLPAEKVVNIIERAGGVPVYAHPGVYLNTLFRELDIEDSLKEIRKLIKKIYRNTKKGLKGIEVYDFYQDRLRGRDDTPSEGEESTKVRYFRELAEKMGIICTTGTDYHSRGDGYERMSVGYNYNLNCPYSIIRKLKKAKSLSKMDRKLKKIFKLLRSETPSERHTALNALRETKGLTAYQVSTFTKEINRLIKCAENEEDGLKRTDTIRALGFIRYKKAIPLLEKFLKNKNKKAFIRRNACLALAHINPSKTLDYFAQTLKKGEPYLLRTTLDGFLTEWSGFAEILNERNLQSLMQINPNHTIELLLSLSTVKSEKVIEKVEYALLNVLPRALADYLTDKSNRDRLKLNKEALQRLLDINSTYTIELLETLADEYRKEMKIFAKALQRAEDIIIRKKRKKRRFSGKRPQFEVPLDSSGEDLPLTHGVGAAMLGEIGAGDPSGLSPVSSEYRDSPEFLGERLRISAGMFFHGAPKYLNIGKALYHLINHTLVLTHYLIREDRQLDIQFLKIQKEFGKSYSSKSQERLGLVPLAHSLTSGEDTGLSDEKILSSYESFWGSFKKWEKELEGLLKKCEEKNIELDSKRISKLKETCSILNKLLPFFLVRFPQGKLRNDERVELVSLLKEIPENLGAFYVPTLHLPKGEFELTQTDEFALRTALARFVSNGAHLKIKNIYVDIKEENNRLKLTIEDDGEGIDKSFLEDRNVYGRQKIFLSGESTREKEGGSGMGMALAWHIIYMLGGDIDTGKSDEYGGAKFIIRLPINSIPPKTPRPESEKDRQGEVPPSRPSPENLEGYPGPEVLGGMNIYDKNRSIVEHIFKGLGISLEDLEWQEREGGFKIARLPLENMNRHETLSAFNLRETIELKGELLIISYFNVPMYLCLQRKETLIGDKIIDLSEYYSISKTTLQSIKSRIKKIFLHNKKFNYEKICFPYIYAIFNKDKELIGIEPRIEGVSTNNIIVRIPVLPGVFNALHKVSLMSAKATAEYTKPGMKVLIMGTGVGLEARIAAGKGALVHATDLNEMAAENTILPCFPDGVEDKINTSVNDLFDILGQNSLGQYDLIIFNMPHYPFPLAEITEGDEKPSRWPIPAMERNTNDENGRLLKRVARDIRKHILPGGRAIIINYKWDEIKKYLKKKTGLRVTTDSFGIDCKDAQAYIIYREPEKTQTIADKKRKINQTKRLISKLITRPKDFDWGKNAKDLPFLKGRPLGVTNKYGRISFYPIKNYRFVWPILGFREEGWKAVITESGVKYGRFEFTVKLTKKGRKSILRTFQIGYYARTLKGQGIEEGKTVEVLEIDDRLGLRFLSELITKSKDFNWEENVHTLPDLQGLRLGITNSRGQICFNPIKYYLLTWRILGFRQEGWEGVIGRNQVQNGHLQFTVILMKEGKKSISRSFQIGPRTRLLMGHSKEKGFKAEVLDFVSLDSFKDQSGIDKQRRRGALILRPLQGAILGEIKARLNEIISEMDKKERKIASLIIEEESDEDTALIEGVSIDKVRSVRKRLQEGLRQFVGKEEKLSKKKKFKPINQSQARETLVKDAGMLVELRNKYLTSEVMKGREFRMRLNRKWIDKSSDQDKIVEEWWNTLKKLFPEAEFYDEIKPNGKMLVTITCSRKEKDIKETAAIYDKKIGEGVITIDNLDTAHHLLGMLNIAFAASNIPDTTDNEWSADFPQLFRFINRQYRLITGKDYLTREELNIYKNGQIDKVQELIDKKIRRIHIPPAQKIDYNRELELDMAIEALRAV